MPKLTDKDTFFGSAIGRFMGDDDRYYPGVLQSRRAYVDFGVLSGPSDLTTTPGADIDDAAPAANPTTANTTVQAGAVFNVTVQMTNTGTTTWTAPDYQIRPTAASVANAALFGFVSAPVSGPILPSNTETWVIAMTAPVGAGTYNIQFQMYNDALNAYFGANTNVLTLTVQVVPVTDDATTIFVSITPNPTPKGGVITVHGKATNTGASVWTPAAYYMKVRLNGNEVAQIKPAGNVNPAASYDLTTTFVAPSTDGTYTLDIQMCNAGAVFGSQDVDSLIVTTGAACVTLGAPTLTAMNGQVGTLSFSYTFASYADFAGGTLIAAYASGTINNMPIPSNANQIAISANTQQCYIPAGTKVVEIYRTASGDPALGTGKINTAVFSAPLSAPRYNFHDFDFGRIGDGTTAPTCAGHAPIIPTLSAKILDNVAVDGTEGGVIEGTELVFDYVDPVYPLNWDYWETAPQWPRRLNALVQGAGDITIRVVGINGWGRTVSARGTFNQGSGVIRSGMAFWKVKRIVVESYTGKAMRLSVGWTAEMGLPWPVRSIPEMGDWPNAVEGNAEGYLFWAAENGVQVPPPWAAPLTGQTAQLEAFPANDDPCGIFFPMTEPDGTIHYEIEYYTDSLDKLYIQRWQDAVDAGTIIIYEE